MSGIIKAAAAAVLLPNAALAQDDALRLPSGLEARPQEVLRDRGAGTGLIYRFRFVARGFDADEAAFDQVSTDLEWLCTEYALPRIADMGPQPARVVISLADRPSTFGVRDADVVQVFESFRPEAGTCRWEMF
ncbi:DUF6497 family protein [Roseovarius sp. D22-M7]|uniref:DUF6497 family protein n=1 Tax=Roseovarius sp. D22-M7 TaxID=3127116 RepID=UPI00300FA45A